MAALTEKEYKIIRHSLGMGGITTVPTEYYRNRYIAGPGTSNYDTLCKMRDAGTMFLVGTDGWYVSPVGKQLFEDQFNATRNS